MYPFAALAITLPPGKWFFVGLFVLLLIWLIVMPKRLVGHEEGVPPWWRNVRFWAIVITLIQLAIYSTWG